MVEQSTATTEAWGFIEWPRAERYTDYTIDCHIRRLLFVMPRLAPGASPPILRDSALVAVFGRERRPHFEVHQLRGNATCLHQVPERRGALGARARGGVTDVADLLHAEQYPIMFYLHLR
jgi:hypothetical protein